MPVSGGGTEDARRRQSLRWRLPAIICGLFLLVLVVILYAAYREVDATLAQAAGERARHAAGQLATLFGRSVAQSFEQLQRLTPGLRDHLRNPDLAAVRAALRPLAPTDNRRITVWDAAGRRLIEEPPDADEGDLPPAEHLPAAGLSPLQASGDRVVLEARVDVNEPKAAGGALLGSISLRSGINISPPETINRLIGSDSRILLGNRVGDVWTDLTAIVPGPRVDLRSDGVREYIAENGEARIGAASGLAGTPWVIWVEVPRAAAVAQARTFVQRMTGIGIVLALATVWLVRSMTTRVTAPLSQITTAAEAMAGGDYSRRVTVERGDEIGRLARSFNTMASEVSAAHRELEQRVQARTKELDAALAALGERSRDREAYLATIVDSSADAIIGQDLDGTITSWNKGAERIFGYTAAEMVGSSIASLAPGDRHREETDILGRIRGGETVESFETVRCTKSGAVIDVSITVSPIRDAAGRIIGSSKVTRDITAHNRAIEAVRAGEERMRFALQNADVGIWDADYTTGVLRWSEILEAHYGIAPGTFEGTFDAFLSRVHPHDRQKVHDILAEAARSGADFSLQHRIVRPDGTVRWVEGAGRIHLGKDGVPLRGVGISIDATQRHTLESQYQQAQKMEAVGRLAGGVAHDFNNLLTAILGYCELILGGLSPTDALRADIAEIQKAGTSAATLTRQLLTFSRKQMIDATRLDLNAIVADMRTLLARLIREDVEIALALSAEPTLVFADRGQMEQILLNLAVNARDAMPRGGKLTIETAHIELNDEYAAAHINVKPGRYVVLAVSDTGTGMTPEVLSHIFEPFYTTKEVGQGTGLGLATVHGIVARSGGNVGVYSEVGKGTSIKVYLPRADHVAAAATEAPLPTRRAGGTQTVLVVDDSSSVRQLARRLLERKGYRALVAGNVDEARQIFGEHPAIDVLLTDVVMPGASGPQLTSQLIEARPSLKVIYMSGYTEEAIVNHRVLASGVAFLHKPFTADALDQKIREVLEGPALT